MFFNSLFHNFLKVLPIFLFFIFITPVILVLSSLFNGYSDNWFHLYNYVLSEYIINSIFLILGVSFFVVLIGVLSSWLVTNYDFFGKSFFEWALILPLAVPPYILAYTFTEIFDTYGSANTLLSNISLFDEKKVFSLVYVIFMEQLLSFPSRFIHMCISFQEWLLLTNQFQ